MIWKLISFVNRLFQNCCLKIRKKREYHWQTTQMNNITMLHQSKNLLNSIVTGDMVFLCDPQAKRQSPELKSKSSARILKFNLEKSKVKVMWDIFLIHRVLSTTNSFLNVQKWTRKFTSISFVVYGMQSDGNILKMEDKHWLLLHENAPAYRSILIKKCFVWNNVTLLCSIRLHSRLAPVDLYVFLTYYVT